MMISPTVPTQPIQYAVNVVPLTPAPAYYMPTGDQEARDLKAGLDAVRAALVEAGETSGDLVSRIRHLAAQAGASEIYRLRAEHYQRMYTQFVNERNHMARQLGIPAWTCAEDMVRKGEGMK
jgi:hypothetical protein